MERLTRKSKTSDMVWFVDHENNNIDLEPCEMNPHHNRLAIQKLAAYEDAEEQGFMIRIPPPDDSDGIPQRVEVAKVVHAKWCKIDDWDDNDNALFECTNCHHGDVHARSVAVPYCWYCGAKMDGKEEGVKNG